MTRKESKRAVMNIWVIGRSYPTTKNKMRGSFEVEQARMLAARGHHVVYLASVLHPFNKVRKWGMDHFQEDGVDVYTFCIPFAPERMHLHPGALLVHMWKKLLGAAERDHGVPDVIHVHYPGMSGMPEVVLRYREKGVGVAVTDHWSKTLMNTMDSFQRRQLTAYANGADAVMCVSAPLKDALRGVSGTQKDIRVTPNIVSSAFHISNGKKADGAFRFVAVGRLVPSKQVDRLTEAFAHAFAGEKNVHLTFVGDGPERAAIEKIAQENHMQVQVHLLGTLTREETAAQIGEADALVTFSRLETFGVPVIEAWACGKPVVASDAVCFLDEWDDALGMQVPKDDVSSLESALIAMRERAGEYDAEALSEFARSHFGEDAVYEMLMSAYADARACAGKSAGEE